MSEQVVTVGRVGKTHGLKGWLRLYSYTEPLDNLLSYQPWLLKKGNDWEPANVEDKQMRGQQLLVKFAGFDVPETARALTNSYIGVTRQTLPELPDGEYYWIDLQGLTVVNTTGIELGKMDHIFDTGANPVMVVEGDKQLLIPYVHDHYVLDIDIDKQLIRVDWELDY